MTPKTATLPVAPASAGSGDFEGARRPGQYALVMVEWEELKVLETIVQTLDGVAVPVTLEVARNNGRAYGVRVMVVLPEIVDLPTGEAGR